MRFRRILPVMTLVGALVAVREPPAHALFAGDQDPSFGDSGIVTTDVNFGTDHAYDIALQGDKKVVAAGGVLAEQPYQSFGLVRYLPDGRLDSSFDGDGIVTTHFGSNSDSAQAVLIQNDARIVAAGWSQMGPDEFAVVRYNSDGSLDPTFGGDGIVSTPVGDFGAEAYGAVLQSDGKILLAGSAIVNGTTDFAAVRYKTDGSLDQSFAGTGIVTTPVGQSHDYAKAVAVQSDGKIVIAGYVLTSNHEQFGLVRLNIDGSLDPTFDDDGILITEIDPNGSFAQSVVVQGDDKIIAGGTTGGQFTLVRYEGDGSLDLAFGVDGIVTTPVGGGAGIMDLLVETGGKITAAGGGAQQVALARYQPDGSVDSSFGGGDGVVITEAGSSSLAEGVTVQPDGKPLIAGVTSGSGSDNFVLARYFGTPVSGSFIPGDFNGDKYADLAVGVPFESVNGDDAAGSVNVIYGSAKRLASKNNQFWNQDSADVLNSTDAEDEFGFALVSGDFNGDGFSDLAVGVPGEDADGTHNAGAVNVLYGSPAGLSGAADQYWTLKSSGLGNPAPSDIFGAALAAGDLNKDGFGDLAIGVPLQDVSSQLDAGGVAVLFGTANGLTASGSQLWTQDTSGVTDTAEFDDEFGSALAIGDFNGNGYFDLAIGVPFEDPSTDAGAVSVLYGSAAGLTDSGNKLWSQDTSGILDRREAGDVFGFTLAAGNFDGNRYDDLAVGVPGENIGSKGNAGGVNVIYGSSTGLSANHNQFWSQDSPGIVDSSERGDLLGFALATGDFNGNGRDDLAIGAPLENVGSIGDAGAVAVIYGTKSRLVASGNQFWSQNSANIKDAAERQDQFGFSLAASDFNGHRYDDLAIGAPVEDTGGIEDSGGLNAIYGSVSRLTASGNQVWTQNSPGILDSAELFDEFGGAVASGIGVSDNRPASLLFGRFDF
jgi:uncharacterized delta-60 repeat protein